MHRWAASVAEQGQGALRQVARLPHHMPQLEQARASGHGDAHDDALTHAHLRHTAMVTHMSQVMHSIACNAQII